MRFAVVEVVLVCCVLLLVCVVGCSLCLVKCSLRVAGIWYALFGAVGCLMFAIGWLLFAVVIDVVSCPLCVCCMLLRCLQIVDGCVLSWCDCCL